MIRRKPIFVVVIALTLVLGLGGTVLFPAVRRALGTPLPYRAPDQLYRLYTNSSSGGDDDKLSAVELSDLAMQSKSIAGVTAFSTDSALTYTDNQRSEQWPAVAVSATFFQVLGIQPILGRPFSVEDFFTGAVARVVVTEDVWRRDLGADKNVVGKQIQLNGRPVVIAAVVPSNVLGSKFEANVLVPLNVDIVMRNSEYAHARIWHSIVRLLPGVTVTKFQSEIDSLRPRFVEKYPDIKGAGAFVPKPLRETITG